MSGKTKNAKSKKSQNVSDVGNTTKNKQKHNSKRRRCKKSKNPVEVEGNPTISKVDEVVNYLCNAISNKDSENPTRINFPFENCKEPEITQVCTGQNHNRNSKFKDTTLSPENNLNVLFENFQIHAYKNPIKSNNIADFLNIDLLKKTKCESLSIEDLEKLKEEKSKKICESKKEKTCTFNENLKEYFNLNMIQNSLGTSVIAQIDTSSMQLVSEIEQTSSKLEKKKEKDKYLKEYINVDALMDQKNNLVTSKKSTSKLLVKAVEQTLLKMEPQENSKKTFKKKAKDKKNNKLHDENKYCQSNQNYLDSDPQSTSSNVLLSSECSQFNKSKTKHQNSKPYTSKNDKKFPKYLALEELKSLSDFGIVLSGLIRINQKNYKEAYITAPDKGMDIVIEGLKDRNRALEGDEVYFVLKAEEHHRVVTDSTDVQRTAVVVGIKTLNHDRKAIGCLNVIKNKNNNFALFSPRDSRIPRIRIRKKNWPQGFSKNPNSFKNKLYCAKILQWNDLRYADGEIVKEIGVAGDLEAETDAILLKYGLDVTCYSDALRQFIPPLTSTISVSEIQKREDFRKDCVFTIDPQTSVDLDDAVSCKSLPNGNFEIGVHISDVSFYLNEGTPLDRAISERATTIYLVQKTFHMLPTELCQLCSLTPGEDKLSFSVMWEVTMDLKIVKHRFARTVINSCAKLSYEQVQGIIDNPSSDDSVFSKIYGGHNVENIKEIILFLNKLAISLRQKRFSCGALKIDQKKIYFSIDENNLPTEYKEEVHEPSHQLIEELMLLANITVAEKLHSSFPELAFLRCHPPPLPYVLKKLQKTFENYGIIINISSSGSIHLSLSKYSGDDTESVARMLVLNNALAKPMARAKYYCGGLFSEEVDRRHYALSVPLYTHFTSPIRRYADVMVHRLLAASLKFCDTPKWNPDSVQSVAANCNKQQYAAKMAQEMSTELYFALFIGVQGRMICQAVVCDIKDKSFDCIGLSTGVHHRLYFEHIDGDIKRSKEDGIFRLNIIWPKDERHPDETLQIIEMFSIVKIELNRANVLKIEAKLLRQE